MQLFLYIRITEDKFVFNNEVITSVKQWNPHVSLFDIDNFSDNATSHTAVKAMQMSERIFLFVEAEPGPELGGVLKVLSQLIKIPVPVAIRYQGDHDMLNKMMMRFKDKLISSDSDLKEELNNFFKA